MDDGLEGGGTLVEVFASEEQQRRRMRALLVEADRMIRDYHYHDRKDGVCSLAASPSEGPCPTCEMIRRMADALA